MGDGLALMRAGVVLFIRDRLQGSKGDSAAGPA